ncbi:hypothetical protein M0R45_007761 [Rubus argutus]|uniref:Uncharacterized protein n=1 Tax=Rubus argutus TaxID=59490 RepID=A0AAW1XZ54_RUBAR
MISSDHKPDSFRLTRVVESEMNSKQSQTTLAEPKAKGRSKTVSSSGNTRVGMVTLLSPVNRAGQLCCYCTTAITINFYYFCARALRTCALASLARVSSSLLLILFDRVFADSMYGTLSPT